MHRIRIHYSKTQPLRYTSNLDIHKIWERTLRRAHLPLAYSQGFHPQPRINQACPLPLGFLSDAEFVDVWLEELIDNETIQANLLIALPPGIDNIRIETIELNSPSPQTTVISASYECILLDEEIDIDLLSRIQEILASDQIIRKRRGKVYDLKPLIIDLHLSVKQNQEEICIFMKLSANQGATGRPDEVLSAIGVDPFDCRILRTSLELKTD